MAWQSSQIESAKADPRVESALEELGIPFEETAPGGDLGIEFSMASGRKHRGFIRSDTFDFEGIELREVYSPGMRSPTPLDARAIDLLLQENMRLKLGKWSVSRNEAGDFVALFKVRVPASARGQQLLAVISAVLRVADDMETRFGAQRD